MDKDKFETGEVLPIYIDGIEGQNLEGWAILIKPKSIPMSIIQSELKETDKQLIDYNAVLSQRWLIRWVDPDKYKITLTFSDRIAQSILVGKKCNRMLYMPIGKWSEVRNRKDLLNNSSHILKPRSFEERQDKSNIIF